MNSLSSACKKSHGLRKGPKWMRRVQKGAGDRANLGGVDADGPQDLQRDQAAAEAASKKKIEMKRHARLDMRAN